MLRDKIKMIKKDSLINKLKLPLLVVSALVIIGGGTYLIVHRFHKAASSVTPAGVNLAPATAEEKQESNQAKSQADSQNQQITPTSPQNTAAKKQVSVIITNASTDSVNAYVSGIFEEGGVCTATFTQGNLSIPRTSTGFSNVSYTQCAPITPNLPNASSWSVVVNYSSAAAEGRSQPQAF